MTVGCVAGDEESYEVFGDLFDPVISGRHGGYAKVWSVYNVFMNKSALDLERRTLSYACQWFVENSQNFCTQ